MTTQHTITAKLHVLFRIPGMPDDEHESANPTVDITYTYLRGSPATYDAARGGPGGWDPPDPAEVDFVGATLVDGDGLAPTDDQVKDWARDWLHDEGYDEACQHAERNSGPDPDHAYEAARDDARDFPERAYAEDDF